jgi:flavin-dependent dehydrogenase
MSHSANDYDVLIVGGGPAGTSAGIHLAMNGARVLLAEQKKFPRAKLCGEFISPECLEHFVKLGVAERMMKAGGVRLGETVFYARGGRAVNVPSEWFGAGGSALGLSRAEMDERLLERARDVGVEVLEDTQATGLLMADGRVCGVSLKSGNGVAETQKRSGELSSGELSNVDLMEAHAPVTIDATGRTRALARRIERGGESLHRTRAGRARLVAFKAHLEGASGVEGNCEIYFYRGGYGGLNHVEGGLSNLCFIAAARDVRACGSDAERVMREVLMSNRRAAETLKGARVRSVWLSVALESFGRRKLVPVDGLLAVGDAASFIDPFTGSGMLMALESGELAAQAIMRRLPELRDGASFNTLAADYRARYAEKFDARLRVCAMLRRMAFVPRLAEAAMLALSASTSIRRGLARATRQQARVLGEEGEKAKCLYKKLF